MKELNLESRNGVGGGGCCCSGTTMCRCSLGEVGIGITSTINIRELCSESECQERCCNTPNAQAWSFMQPRFNIVTGTCQGCLSQAKGLLRDDLKPHQFNYNKIQFHCWLNLQKPIIRWQTICFDKKLRLRSQVLIISLPTNMCCSAMLSLGACLLRFFVC